MGTKFYIEHYECLKGGRWAWVRIPGATASRLKDAEELKLALAKQDHEPAGNFSIVVSVEQRVRDSDTLASACERHKAYMLTHL